MICFALLLLAGCKPGTSMNGVPVGPPGPLAVTLEDFDFLPKDATVSVGQTVVFTNKSSGTVHSVTRDLANSTGPSSPDLSPEQSFSFVVPSAPSSGPNLFYHCRFHGIAGNGTSFGDGMVGVLRIKQ